MPRPRRYRCRCRAATRRVKGTEVGPRDEEPPDNAHEQQRQELQDHGDVLEPGHLAHASELITAGIQRPNIAMPQFCIPLGR